MDNAAPRECLFLYILCAGKQDRSGGNADEANSQFRHFILFFFNQCNGFADISRLTGRLPMCDRLGNISPHISLPWSTLSSPFYPQIFQSGNSSQPFRIACFLWENMMSGILSSFVPGKILLCNELPPYYQDSPENPEALFLHQLQPFPRLCRFRTALPQKAVSLLWHVPH